MFECHIRREKLFSGCQSGRMLASCCKWDVAIIEFSFAPGKLHLVSNSNQFKISKFLRELIKFFGGCFQVGFQNNFSKMTSNRTNKFCIIRNPIKLRDDIIVASEYIFFDKIYTRPQVCVCVCVTHTQTLYTFIQ